MVMAQRKIRLENAGLAGKLPDKPTQMQCARSYTARKGMAMPPMIAVCLCRGKSLARSTELADIAGMTGMPAPLHKIAAIADVGGLT